MLDSETKLLARPWHALDANAPFAELDTTAEGLTEKEAIRRLAEYGHNRLQAPKRQSGLRRFLAQFHNVLIYVLVGAAIMTAFLQHWVDTGVILAVVLLNALIGFIQEGKAEKALEAIRNLLSHQASVMRDGVTLQLPADELVPGDVVRLQSGDKVPADLRLFHVKDLRAEEAMLTGESVPVEKSADAVAADAAIGDRFCMAYSGTLVTYGQATGVVIATGDATEIGRISTLLGKVKTITTALLQQMAVFGKWLTLAILVVASATFAFGVLLQGYTATDMFLAAVGLAVAAIPEGLPAIMTITLAIGVQRMARRNAIIRRLPAVETLGSVTVICSDKTGTLTRNEMTVKNVIVNDDVLDVGGSGYDPQGEFSCTGTEVPPPQHAELIELARAGMLCNDSNLRLEDGQWTVHGDPTEAALLTLGMKAGLEHHLVQQEWPRKDVIPFESEHRFMASLHHDCNGNTVIFVKGAPERILEMCVTQRSASDEGLLQREHWSKRMHELASRGQRVLAVAQKITHREHLQLELADVSTGFMLLGMVGIIDPPREEAIRAVQQCQRAGMRVKMITGDHAATAVAIGYQLHIGDGKSVLSGRDLDAMTGDELAQGIEEVDVFARTSPENKLFLVEQLQAHGHVVAMTGDGVNDAPALKRANVGIAMGRKGTEVAKEASEMVLADDNFASIAHAIEEGRTVYDNLKKAILFILPTNGGEALTVIAAIILGRTLPITPVQILWVNMITAVTLALALAFEPTEKGTMLRPPRDPRDPILSGLLIWRIVFVSFVLLAGTLGLFLYVRSQGADIETARTVAVNTLVVFEIFYLWNSRFIYAPVLNWNGLFGNRLALMAMAILLFFQMAFTYFPPMQTLFATRPIGLQEWGLIVCVGSSVLFLVEIEKAWMRARQNKPSRP